MFLCSLIGTEQNNDRCVVLYENLMFDWNEDFSLKQTMNNLNYCCSSEKRNIKFVKCFQTVLFTVTSQPILKKNQKKKDLHPFTKTLKYVS